MQADEKLRVQAEQHIGRRVSLWGAWTDDRPFHTGTLVKAEDHDEDGYCFFIDFDDDGQLRCPVTDFDTITVHKEDSK